MLHVVGPPGACLSVVQVLGLLVMLLSVLWALLHLMLLSSGNRGGVLRLMVLVVLRVLLGVHLHSRWHVPIVPMRGHVPSIDVVLRLGVGIL